MTEDSSINQDTVEQTAQEKASGKKTARDSLLSFILEQGVLALALLGITGIASLCLYYQAYTIANKWTESLRYTASYAEKGKASSLNEVNKLKPALDRLNNGTSAEKDRLFDQLQETAIRAKNHIEIAKSFYIWNYQTITLATLTSIVAAISLFFFGKEGWVRANKYVVNVFIVSSGLTIVLGIFPLVFKQEENISNNTKSYLAYIALDNRIRSYIATNQFFTVASVANSNSALGLNNSPVTNTNKLVDLSNVIHYIDNELATLNNIYVGFDSTKIPNY